MTPSLLSPSLLLAAAILSGCAGQTHVPKPIDSPAAAAQWQERRLDDPRLLASIAEHTGAAVRPVSEWGLVELTLAAFHFHPDLDRARAELRAAAATRRVAETRAEPRLGMQADHHAKADGISPWTLGVALEIPLELGDRRAARGERAAALGEAAQLEAGLVAWQVRSRLRTRQVEWLHAEARSEFARREQDLQQDVVQLLESRVAAGAAAAGELAEARLRRQQAEAALAAEASAAMTARAELAAAVGVPLEALASLRPAPAALDREHELPADELRAAAVLNRLDLRAGLARYAAAEAKLRLEIARQYPEVALAPGVAYDQGDRVWSLGASLLLALFDRNAAGIAEAEAQREVEGRAFLALQARVLGEQAAAAIACRAALAARWPAAASLQLVRRQAEAAERRLAAGHDDRLEVVRRRLEVLAAERADLAARAGVERAFGALEDSVQRPLDGTLPKLSASGDALP